MGLLTQSSLIPLFVARPVHGAAALYVLSVAPNRAAQAATIAFTAASASSPVSVLDGCRKRSPKCTLCHPSATLPPLNVSRYVSASRVGPATFCTSSASSDQASDNGTTSDRSRAITGNNGRGLYRGRRLATDCTTSKSSSAAEHAPRSSSASSRARSTSPR